MQGLDMPENEASFRVGFSDAAKIAASLPSKDVVQDAAGEVPRNRQAIRLYQAINAR